MPILNRLNPILSAGQRSAIKQGLLRSARGFDPTNGRYANFTAPIILLGAARGGTTLLANIIGAHPRIDIYHERFTIGKDSYRDTFGSTHGTADLRDRFIRYLPHDLKQENRRWGIKICTYHWNLEDYSRFIAAFPRAQFVFVLRDGRDVVLSMLKRSVLWKTAEVCASRWLDSVAIYDHLCASIPARLYTFHYEDLIADPERQVRQICAFVGESFQPAMMDHQNWPGVGSYEITPIRKDRVGKWKEQAFPALPSEMEDKFAAALARLGYPVTTEEEK